MSLLLAGPLSPRQAESVVHTIVSAYAEFDVVPRDWSADGARSYFVRWKATPAQPFILGIVRMSPMDGGQASIEFRPFDPEAAPELRQAFDEFAGILASELAEHGFLDGAQPRS